MADVSEGKMIKKYSSAELNEMMSGKLRYLAKQYGASPEMIKKDELISFIITKQGGDNINTEAKPVTTGIPASKLATVVPIKTTTRAETPEEEEEREASEEENEESPEVETPPLPPAKAIPISKVLRPANIPEPIVEPEPEPEPLLPPIVSKKVGSKSEIIMYTLTKLGEKLNAVGLEVDILNALVRAMMLNVNIKEKDIDAIVKGVEKKNR
jgi:ribosomal protein L12E/L44/L45/RPP1/RPP2